jgi:hypothetical protein
MTAERFGLVATSVSEWISPQLPKSYAPYTKVAKSAKKELEMVSSFALFAILV